MSTRHRFTVCGLRSQIAPRLIACLVLCLLSSFGYSQDDDDAPIPTLRVYTNVLQIPTLVLTWQHKPIPNIAESRFFVSIDSGPKSRVAHVRLEGDDPIALAILVDATRLPGFVRSKIPEAIAALAPSAIHPSDSVSVYDLDCQLSRAVVERPPTKSGLGETAQILFAPERGAPKSHGSQPCPQQHWNLLDAIVSAVHGLQDEPGRRVLLVLSDGKDRGSRATWDAARASATGTGVAIFGIVASSEMKMPLVGPRGMMGVQAVSAPTNMPALCESTGGMVLDNTDSGLASQLRDFLALVRGRYIVEFPRPDTGAGFHTLDISVDKLDVFIRPAGVEVPIADPELAKDPNTIMTGPSNAPAVGTKRPKQ